MSWLSSLDKGQGASEVSDIRSNNDNVSVRGSTIPNVLRGQVHYHGLFNQSIGAYDCRCNMDHGVGQERREVDLILATPPPYEGLLICVRLLLFPKITEWLRINGYADRSDPQYYHCAQDSNSPLPPLYPALDCRGEWMIPPKSSNDPISPSCLLD
jgi:hypothetical protein